METTPDTDLPLDGLVVLDFSQYLAGPSCALRLADLGAEVIKVERPQGGDACRQLSVADQTMDGDSVLFHTINRNKRSIGADLKNPADLTWIRSLLFHADVMIHNFRPGVMDRLQLDFAAVQALNPSLVYGVVSGYGNAGPWRDKPGQDLLVQSLSGFAWLNGDADDGPVPAGVSVADILTGAHLAQGILAALVRRGVSGRGALVEVSLLESIFDLQFEQFTTFLNGDRTNPVRGAVNGANVHAAAPYGIYRTGDGHLAVAMTPIDRLGDLLDCGGLAAFDRKNWFSERDRIKRVLADHLATQPTAHWLGLLESAGVWCAEVMDWERLSGHDGFRTLDLVQHVRSASGQEMPTTRCPIRIDGRILKAPAGAPRLGADNDLVRGRFQ